MKGARVVSREGAEGEEEEEERVKKKKERKKKNTIAPPFRLANPYVREDEFILLGNVKQRCTVHLVTSRIMSIRDVTVTKNLS